MSHVGMAMTLKPGCYDEYKRRHDELWPEMAEAMTARGVNLVIYRFDDLLFVHGSAPSADAWGEMARDPVHPAVERLHGRGARNRRKWRYHLSRLGTGVRVRKVQDASITTGSLL